MRISLSQAVQNLQQGQVVAVPTETVYGLAASLSSVEGIEKVFALKKRPPANPLIIHVPEIAAILPYVKEAPPFFQELAYGFWPGPLTLILPIKEELIPAVARAGLPTAGFRVPKHPLTLELLRQTGPLVMPSANLSGRPSATIPEHVEEDFGEAVPVLEGGACQKGVESTILMYEQEKWVIVRLGSLAPDAFKMALGYAPAIVQKEAAEKPLCPGQLFRHYAPRAHLTLGGKLPMQAGTFILGFSDRYYPFQHRVIHLGSSHNPAQVAERLYYCLRQLDQEGAQEAWVDMNFPREGLWLTIAERLERAAQS